MSHLKPVTLLLVLANLVAYYLQQGSGDELVRTFGLWPVEGGHFEPGQVLTVDAFGHLLIEQAAR